MPGFKVTITRKGVPTVYRFHNVLVGGGVREVLRKPTLFALGSPYNHMGFYSAGTITAASTLAAPSFTEFTGYDNQAFSVRMSCGISQTLNTLNDTITINIATGPSALITASSPIIGLFICNNENPVFDATTRIFAGGEFDTPVSVLPGDTVDAEYEAVISI